MLARRRRAPVGPGRVRRGQIGPGSGARDRISTGRVRARRDRGGAGQGREVRSGAGVMTCVKAMQEREAGERKGGSGYYTRLYLSRCPPPSGLGEHAPSSCLSRLHLPDVSGLALASRLGEPLTDSTSSRVRSPLAGGALRNPRPTELWVRSQEFFSLCWSLNSDFQASSS
jgi:hypothetical protein